jgi:hypothetical protein
MPLQTELAPAAWDGRVHSHALSIGSDRRELMSEYQWVGQVRVADPLFGKPVQV